MANDDSIDKKRRQLLTRATQTLGAVGLVAAGIPFATSLWPSAKALSEGGPVKVNLKNMKPGDQLTVFWRGKPVWIIRRKPEAVKGLAKLNSELRDPMSDIPQQPDNAKNLYRSIKPEFLVLVGICTHLGCTPTYRPDPHSVDADWPGGFYCSCHGSKFDLAGRVFKGVPAPINLEVPPYVFLSEEEILIGLEHAPQASG